MMKRNAVNFVVDNTTTMHTVDRHVTRFALAKGVVDELILDFGKKNTHNGYAASRCARWRPLRISLQ
jgi:hypothetical protein